MILEVHPLISSAIFHSFLLFSLKFMKYSCLIFFISDLKVKVQCIRIEFTLEYMVGVTLVFFLYIPLNFSKIFYLIS